MKQNCLPSKPKNFPILQAPLGVKRKKSMEREKAAGQFALCEKLISGPSVPVTHRLAAFFRVNCAHCRFSFPVMLLTAFVG